jgi:hypothetical protein
VISDEDYKNSSKHLNTNIHHPFSCEQIAWQQTEKEKHEITMNKTSKIK